MLKILVAVLSLASQEPAVITPQRAIEIESCVDGSKAMTQCAGLEWETTYASLCFGTREFNADMSLLLACVGRISDACLDTMPVAGDRTLYARWCGVRVRGGVSNVVAGFYERNRARLPEPSRDQFDRVFIQAATDRDLRVQNLDEPARSDPFRSGAIRTGMLTKLGFDLIQAF